MEEKKSKIDRLCWRMPENIDEAHVFADFFFPEATWEPRDRGGLGYERTYQVRQAKDLLCTVYAGGTAQRGTMYFDVTGKGCSRVAWDDSAYRAAFDGLGGAKLRRIDIAVDFYHGEKTLDQVKADYEAGKFTHRKQPKFRMHGDPYGIDGMTYYIGKQGQEMCFKFYEKGKEQGSEEFPNWNRAELTLAPSNRHMFLPPTLFMENRDDLFAGAYPALAEMLPEASPLRLERIRTLKGSLDAVLGHMQKQYGPILAAALYHYEGDFLQVWDKICAKHPNPYYMPKSEGATGDEGSKGANAPNAKKCKNASPRGET